MASTKLDPGLINKLKQKGAIAENCGSKRNPLYSVIMTLNDAAHRIFVEYCLQSSGVDDPLVSIVAVPPTSGVTPQLTDVFTIIMEASGILSAYQNLADNSFSPGQSVPAVAVPLILPENGIIYHNASITSHKVLERISNPGIVCPIIDQQASGTLVCAVRYGYANAYVSVRIPRA